jgi:DNA-binding transcriptional LysR family regulator
MAIEGHGLAFLPQSTVRGELAAGRRLVPATAPGSYELTMEVRLYRERPAGARHSKPQAQALWEFLAEQG